MISILALTACGKSDETTKTETTNEVNSDAKEELSDLANGASNQVDSAKEEALHHG